MLGVAVLLASSSMAAIELITLYARLDNAVHKMAPPSHLSLRLPQKKNTLLLKNLVSSLLAFFISLWTPNNEEMLLLCRATDVEMMQKHSEQS